MNIKEFKVRFKPNLFNVLDLIPKWDFVPEQDENVALLCNSLRQPYFSSGSPNSCHNLKRELLVLVPQY